MGQTLKSNYTSEESKRTNILTHKPKTVRVWVEDETDLPFWNSMLNPNDANVNFHISPYQWGPKLIKGKSHILGHYKTFGENLIACVDSDYDYLLPESSKNAKIISESDYVLQTYTYSIENYCCHPKTLKELCTNATLAMIDFDFEKFLLQYSSIVYPLLLWSLLLRTKSADLFTFEDFGEIIKFDTAIDNNNQEDILNNLNKKVKTKVSQLELKYSSYTSEIEVLENYLKTRNFTKREDSFLFIQGHILYDNIETYLLLPLCKEVKRNHIKSILESTADPKDKDQKKKHYENKTKGAIKILFSSNFEHKNHCKLYKNIKHDIDNLLDLIQKKA